MNHHEEPAVAQPAVDREHPYLGLQAFHEQESEFFYGRDREIMDIFRLVRRDVLTVLFGISGLGKTSLLNAGLFPRLREAKYLPVRIRLDFAEEADDLIVQIKHRVDDAVGKYCVDTPSTSQQETLWEYFHRTRFWDHKNRLLTPVLVFDQFEESFTLGRGDERLEPFLQELSDVIENHIPAVVRARMEESGEEIPFKYDQPRAKVMFSLREDYLAYLEELVPLIPSLSRNRYRLTHMDGDRACEAVFKPGEHLLSRDVAEDIVRFVAGQANGGDEKSDRGGLAETASLEDLEVEPALLSLVCRELNEQRLKQGLRAITGNLVSGSKGSIISDFYEASISNLGPVIRVFIEDELLTATGHRKAEALEDAIKLHGVSRQAIDTLVNRRLLRLEERMHEPHVELIHDVLTGIVQESRQRRHEMEAIRDREHKAQQRRRETIKLVFSLGGALCIVLAIVAFYQRYNAEVARADAERARAKAEVAQTVADEARKKAESRELSQASAKYIDLDPMLSLILARIANEEKVSTFQALGALHNAILASQFRRNLLGHEQSVRDVAYSPDGKWIATASYDKTVRLWNAETGEWRHTLEGHDGAVTAAAFSSKGRLLVTASDDNTAKLWDIETGEEIYTVTSVPEEPRKRSRNNVNHVAFGSEDQWVITVSSSQGPKLWDTKTGKLHRSLKEHKGAVTAVSVSRNRKWLAAASDDKTARLWNVETGNMHGIFKEHGDAATAVAVTEDGKWVATASDDNISRLWNAETGHVHRTFEGHPSEVTAVAFSPSGTNLAVAYTDGVVQMFDRKPESSPREFRAYTSRVSEVAFSPDGSRLAIASGDSVQVWNTEQRSLIFRLVGHSGKIKALSFSPDGNQLATAGQDKSAKLWNVAHNEELPTLIGHRDQITAVAFSPEGQWMASASNDRTVRLYDVKTDRLKHTIACEKKHATVPCHDEAVNAVAFSPDGQLMATGSADKTAMLWDTRTGERFHTLEGHDGAVTAVAFGHNRRLLATASEDGLVRLWDPDTGIEKHPPLESATGKRRDNVYGITFSPDDKLLATANEDGTVGLWDWQLNKEIKTFETLHNRPVYDVAFSPNGNLLAAAANTTAMIWDLTSVEEAEPIVLKGRSRRLSDIAFSPDGATLATARSDESVKLWDAKSGELRFTLLGHTDAVTSVAYSPDGKLLATGSTDQTIHRYALDVELLKTLAVDRIARRLTEAECLGDFNYLDECEAKRLLAEGRKYARAEDIERATEKFREAQKMLKETQNKFKEAKKLAPVLEFDDADHYAKTLAADTLQIKARQLISEGDADSAIIMLENARVYNPDLEVDAQEIKTKSARALENVSKRLARSGNGSGAYETVLKAVNLSPDDGDRLKTDVAKRLLVAGKRMVRRGDPDRAREAFETARKLDPETNVDIDQELAEAMVAKAKKLAASGDSDQALKTFREALELDHGIAVNPELEVANGLVKKGQRVARSGNTGEAEKIFMNAKTLYPKLDLDIYEELANGLVSDGKAKARSGDVDAAEQAFDRALDFNPALELDTNAEIAKGFIQLGRSKAKSGRLREAIAAYDKALEINPDHKITGKQWNSLCWDGSLWGHAHEVMDACIKAVEADKDSVGNRDSRGVARAVTGDTEGAIEDFQYYVNFGKDKERTQNAISKRERWIAALKRGENPFTPSVLKSLRSERPFSLSRSRSQRTALARPKD